MRQALTTPLMAGLARAIYNPRPGELAETLRDPVELCDQADQQAVESLLFDAFIPATYRPRAGGRWKARDAEGWLVFPARHLERTIGSPDLAWWQLEMAIPRIALRLARFAVGLMLGLVLGLVLGLGVGLVHGLEQGLSSPPWVGILIGLSAGLVALLTTRPSSRAPAHGVKISARRLRLGLKIGLAVGGSVTVVFGLVVAIFAGPLLGLLAGSELGLFVGLPAALLIALTGRPGDLAKSTSPRTVLVRDRQAALLLTLLAGASIVVI